MLKQVGFEPEPEDSYGRCGSDKLRQTVPAQVCRMTSEALDVYPECGVAPTHCFK